MSGYAIRGGDEGRRRLDLLARTMAPNTEALLARAGLRAGMRCIDLGCGGGHVSRYLAECVGAAGLVIGLDIDDIKLRRPGRTARWPDCGNWSFARAA
jgi:cyclopropane fatty-acyl-phospholipid synthase-like methyltransferase